MLIFLILLFVLLRGSLRNIGGDFTFALILITIFFVKLNTKRSTANTIRDCSDIEKCCQPKIRQPNYNYNSDSDYDYNNHHKQYKRYTALECKTREVKRRILEHEFYFQRLWAYSMLALLFFVCAFCIPYALMYTTKVYYKPEHVSRPEHQIMGFIAAIAVIAVVAHQI